MTPRRFPYGYQMKNGKIEICNDEAEIVRWIFQKRMNGSSGYQIAKELYDAHTVYFSDSIRKTACKVSQILYDARYIGDTHYPPIVERDIFLWVQEMKGKPFCEKAPSSSTEKSSHTVLFEYIPSDEISNREQTLINDKNTDKDAIFALAAEKYNCITERSTP